jgi:hypothetical protein
MVATIIFGRNFNDTPQPMTVQGMPGWFSVPRQWYGKPFPGGSNQWIVCERADFSEPTYLAVLGDDGITMCFQQLLLEKLVGISA